MSILGQLRKINAGQAAQLYNRHPLAQQDREARLRYLGAVALACAPEREAVDLERRAFLALGRSLGLETEEAAEQFDERTSVQEDDIRRMFAHIRAANLRWLYLLDVGWMHLVDGAADEAEIAMQGELAAMLDADGAKVAQLHALLVALRDRRPGALARQLPAWARDPELQRWLPQVLRRCFPFAGMLQERWIDHGDGSVTDVRSGLRWQRGPVFGASPHPDQPGVAICRREGDTEAVVAGFNVRPHDEVKPRDLLARLDTPEGQVEVRAGVQGTVMELLAQVGDTVAPGAALLSVATAGGPEVLTLSLAEDCKPTDGHLHAILREAARANTKEAPAGMSPWRLPDRSELDGICAAASSFGDMISLGFMGASIGTRGASNREFAPGIFTALEGRKVWCRVGPDSGAAPALAQLGVFNARADGDAVLLLCRAPLEENTQ